MLFRSRSTLAENGLLYIAVPNSLKIYHDLEKHWFRNVHTYYFNKFSLTSLMKICGFRILGLTEGDQYNKAEIYLVVQKAGKEPPSFSASHFNLQKEVYQKALRRDGNIILKVLTLLKNRLASLLNI